MESWTDDFFAKLDAFADEVEQLMTDVAKDLSQTIDAIAEATDDIMEQIHTTFINDIEQQFTEFFEPLVDACLGMESVVEDSVQPFVHTIDPLLSNRAVCAGCRHYHGQMYGENLLVCGMHPYGWDGEQCPDWQSTWE